MGQTVFTRFNLKYYFKITFVSTLNHKTLHIYIYTYKHCTWRSATAVKTLVQECCEKSVLFFFLLISFICTSIRISFDFLIYILKIAELDCCQIMILRTINTRLYTCLTSIPRFALREKVTLRLLKLLFLGSGCVRVV